MATTAEYLNKLVTQKNTLADNLVTKGVSASHDETLETLVPKVLEISGGGGDDTMDVINSFPDNPIDNKPYLYPNSDIGDIIAVHYDSVWHFTTLNQYPFEHMLYAAELYSMGQVIETPSESVSVIKPVHNHEVGAYMNGCCSYSCLHLLRATCQNIHEP